MVSVKAGAPDDLQEIRTAPNSITGEYDPVVGFLDPMVEELSSEETTSPVFDSPAAKKALEATLSGRMAKLQKELRLFMAEIFLPTGFEVVEIEERVNMQEFCKEARQLWESYESRLGALHPITILQMDDPTEGEVND